MIGNLPRGSPRPQFAVLWLGERLIVTGHHAPDVRDAPDPTYGLFRRSNRTGVDDSAEQILAPNRGDRQRLTASGDHSDRLTIDECDNARCRHEVPLNFGSVSRPAVLPHDEFGDRRIRRLAAPDQDRGASRFGSRRLARFVAHLVHTGTCLDAAANRDAPRTGCGFSDRCSALLPDVP